MSKNIQIDDLFRDKLLEGEEQLNLGAWANMERMLDGKNPYSDTDRRKRRIIPFILLFTLLSAVVSAGYISLIKSKKDTKNEVASTLPIAENNLKSDLETTLSDSAFSNSKNIPSTQNSTDKRDKSKKNKKAIALKPNTKKTELLEETQASSKKINIYKKNNSHLVMQKHENINASEKAKKQEKRVTNDKTQNELETANNKTENTTDASHSTVNTKTEKINQYNINQRIKTDRKGNQYIEEDTTSKLELINESTQVEASNPIALSPEQSNPRLVNVTPEEELAIHATVKNIQSEATTLAPKLTNTHTEEPKLTPIKSSSIKKDGDSFIEKLRTFAAVNYQKMSLLTTSLINMGYPMIPGISIGVNAALFNPKNNFGGFHIGLSNLKPLGDRISILTELKYFIRNNSGYTIDDITTVNKNLTADNITLASQGKTIYKYQVDSSVNNYNFKNFSSIEMPIMLQAHLRSFTIYGGINLAYIFKLHVNENKHNYVLNKEEIIDNNLSFIPKQEMIKQYSREDFTSRFGLGYTIGAAYSFSPNIYLDLRLTQNVWDNAKTISAKEVSAGYFKVPTMQLSLGYRFKKFTPNR